MTSEIELVDTHCHLDYEYDGKTEADLVREASDAGVKTLVTIGVELGNAAKVAEISDRHARVFHTVGVHPHEAAAMKDSDIEQLRRAAAHPKCRAIGEIGLDYHYDHSPRDVQRARLKELLDLALEVKLPVVIHSREGEDDLLPELQRFARAKASGGDARPPGIIHCFTGTREFAQSCLAEGFLISLSGVLTFKKSDVLREIARDVPLDRLLVETDSPYLAPVPHRGKKCEPSMVRLTAEKLAELKGLPLSEIAAATTRNAFRVFGIAP